MGETKAKKVRRPKKNADSPTPTGPVGGMIEDTENPPCGHSSCGRNCMVRYVGPTSHLHDHHIIHAARGVAHVWTAAIVAGLAVVLTGAIAYTAVEAQSASSTQSGGGNSELSEIRMKLNNVEAMVKKLLNQCTVQPAQPGNQSGASSTGIYPPPPAGSATGTNAEVKSCLRKCSDTLVSCLRNAGDKTDARQACLKDDQACRASCNK